jgi:hypothetical protein
MSYSHSYSPLHRHRQNRIVIVLEAALELVSQFTLHVQLKPPSITRIHHQLHILLLLLFVPGQQLLHVVRDATLGLELPVMNQQIKLKPEILNNVFNILMV